MERQFSNVAHPIKRIMSLLSGVHQTSTGYIARCPSHDDGKASLRVSQGDDGRVLLKCFAGCTIDDILKSLRLTKADLFVNRGAGGTNTPHATRATLQHPDQPTRRARKTSCKATDAPLHGCTLAEYSEMKQLPIRFLKSLGLSDVSYQGSPAIRIPYYDPSGNEAAIRFRATLTASANADDRFKWKKGAKPCLYGLNRIRNKNYTVVVEGESDCQTLWYHGYPALGIPGATNWREERDAPCVDGYDCIYVLVEPDAGGDAVKKWAAKSRIRENVKLVFLSKDKDASALYLRDPDNFKTNFQEALDKAISYSQLERIDAETAKAAAWAECRPLAQQLCILDVFGETIRRLGVVGEERNAKILFLALVSRYLARPVSVVLKGPSAGGKSFIVEMVLKLCPQSAYYSLTSMSEHALVYSDEPLKNRVLVIFEAVGLSSDTASYIIRSLLSEGCVRYETVEKTKEGIRPRLIEREGPTGLIVTTTNVNLHPENETRMLSLTVLDTPAQTRAVLKAVAKARRECVDLSQWHALHVWLDHANHEVTIPYAEALAESIPPVAVRLRRDFTALLHLISANAILHQASRARDKEQRIVATVEDYATVRELVSDIVSDGIEATVPASLKETVGAVRSIISEDTPHATVQRCATVLKIDKSSASRRVRAAIAKGYLVNAQKQKGRPAEIELGDPLPEELEIFPSPQEFERCAVARDLPDDTMPPPSSSEDGGVHDAEDERCTDRPPPWGRCQKYKMQLHEQTKNLEAYCTRSKQWCWTVVERDHA